MRKNKQPPPQPITRPGEPAHILADPIAHEAWERACDDLQSLGILSQADRAIIELYALTYAEWSGLLGKPEVMDVGDKGYQQVSPWFTARNKVEERLFGLLKAMGLTPASRIRLGLRVQGQQGENPWGRWMGDADKWQGLLN